MRDDEQDVQRHDEPGARRDSAAAAALRRRICREAFLTLPNQLTLLRLFLIPLIGLAQTIDFNGHDQVSVTLYALAAFTDTLDGQIARRRNLITEFGKLLDPIADKLLVITVLVIMVGQAVIPAWVVVVIFAREFIITGLRSLAASQGVVISASAWGKSKTLTQNMMIGLLMLARPYPVLHPVAVAMTAIAIVATVLSGLDYLWRYRRFVF